MVNLFVYCLLLIVSCIDFHCGFESNTNIDADEEKRPVDDELIDKTPESDYDEDSLEERDPEDKEWKIVAIRDIAFYLRSHKFNDFDRRYYTLGKPIVKEFVANFPNPPLRSLHWEVRKFCDEDFESCLSYLHSKVILAELKRSDDTTTVMKERKLDVKKNGSEVKKINDECLKLYNFDYIGGVPFLGPLERFQWRTTASYYMCWYTLRETKDLAMFGEECDNHSRCLDDEWGAHNGDVRAVDAEPFACARYSFCPDACCPLRLARDAAMCRDDAGNPCAQAARANETQCAFNSSLNVDFVSIVLNHWNMSCNCSVEGFEWDPRYRMCVDVDECLTGSHSCDADTESCFNLPGGYNCGCRWGLLYNSSAGRCLPSAALGQGVAAAVEAAQRDLTVLSKIHFYLEKARKRIAEFFQNVGVYFFSSKASEVTPFDVLLHLTTFLCILWEAFI